MMTENEDERRWLLNSPSRRIEVEVHHRQGLLSYSVRVDGVTMLAGSPVGIFTSVADFRDQLVYLSEVRTEVNETYTMIAGKSHQAVNHCHELRLRLGRSHYAMDWVIRAYDDAVAYRYEIGGQGPIRIYAETSGFALATISGWQSWAQTVTVNYEEFYPLRQGAVAGAYNFPMLWHHPENAWMLLSEAAVYGNYCGSHVVADDSHPGLLRVVFAVDQINPLQALRPFQTPWRVAMLGRTLSDIFSSTVIENLNPPTEWVDTDWIRPGRVYWSWWAGEPQDRLDVQKQYVDFAANMGWEYFLCDAGWRLEWLAELIDYARTRKVGIILWVHHRDLLTDDSREEKLALWAKLGALGVKVDFFDSDCQERIRIYDALAEETARHHLLLNYHGATKPSGERRRWPHLLTREGIYGAEYYRDHDGPTAEHNCTVPFTRNVVGPMDYTPVTYSKVHGQTTITHQLALPVIFESNLQHLSESVERWNDYGALALECLKACPATWDQSELIDGYPGQWVAIARRRGDEWFIGVITAWEDSREMSLPLQFLSEGTSYQARRYQDNAAGTQIVTDELTLARSTAVDLTLAARGGAVVWLKPSPSAI